MEEKKLWGSFEKLTEREIERAIENGAEPGTLDAIAKCVEMITKYHGWDYEFRKLVPSCED